MKHFCTTFIIILLSIIINTVDAYIFNTIKSAKLSPSQKSQNGASVMFNIREVTPVHQTWHVNPISQNTWQFIISIDNTFGFDLSTQSSISITIDTPTFNPQELLFGFTTNNKQYISTLISLNTYGQENKIYPACDQYIKSPPTPFGIGDIASLPNQNRLCDISGGSCNNWQHMLPSNNFFTTISPITFTLENDPSNNQLLFYFKSQSTANKQIFQKCKFGRYTNFVSNDGLKIYMAQGYTTRPYEINSFDIISHVKIPTLSPTQQPTNNPTISPTNIPSFSPTNNPSLTPTNNPTITPTKYPTNYPTITPTNNPTKYPSNNPTKYPTMSPSKYPTKYPTNYPSKFPSYNPSITPTKYPTISPSKYPTQYPTNYPSKYPSNYPTVTPTKFPSKSPTKYPSKYPTISPTLNPTYNPSKSPSKSPSNIPSITPTNFPTISPTLKPTNYPSEPPTKYPTYNPTQSPTNNPSNIPTKSPSNIPTMTTPSPFTMRPTNNPSKRPTNIPSYTPTISPTISPTTVNPTTAMPTQKPTPIGFQWGVYDQLCAANTNNVFYKRSDQKCDTVNNILSDINGNIFCDVSYDCCMCQTIQCGFTNPCNELTVMGDYGIYGVKDIHINGDPYTTNGVSIDCQGIQSCKDTNIYASNVNFIDCDGEYACSMAVIKITNPKNGFVLECAGVGSCEGLQIDILFPAPDNGFKCNPNHGKEIFQFTKISCNNDRACKGLRIKIQNDGCDSVHIDSLECIQPNSCNNAMFNFIGDVIINNCLCGPSCNSAFGLNQCFNNLEKKICFEPLSCAGQTKIIENPRNAFYFECSAYESCALSNFVIELNNNPNKLENVNYISTLLMHGEYAAKGTTFTIDNKQGSVVTIGKIQCSGHGSCQDTIFITGMDVVVGEISCAPQACVNCQIKQTINDRPIPCDASQISKVLQI